MAKNSIPQAENDLTPIERLERIATLHQPITEGINEGFCCGCEFAWPCPTRRLAHVLPTGSANEKRASVHEKTVNL